MRFRVLLVVAVLAVFVAGCGEETAIEKQEEEAGVEEVSEESQPKTQPQSAFAGEHENLKPGDTAEWNAGMQITVEDAHIAPNELRRVAEERKADREANAKEKGTEGKEKGKAGPPPPEELPEQLIAFSWTITNEGQMPINFKNELPCTALDSNGMPLPRAGVSTAEEMYVPPGKSTSDALEQPLEQGQVRSGILSIPMPENGAAEFICAYPPQAGGRPEIAQIPEAGKATWILDPAELEFRG